MEATVQETDGTAVLGALERAMSPSALKKTGTLGKLFETKTPSVTVLTNGRSRSPTDPRKRKDKGKLGPVLSKQMSFMDQHGRSVRGRQNLKMQADQRNWKAEHFVANQAELPKHLSIGTRVEHTERGWGTVVNLQSWYPPTVSVEFDHEGEIHTYKAAAWWKLALLPESHELGAALVGMVQRGEFRMVQKMEQDGKFDPTPERAAAEAAQRGGAAKPTPKPKPKPNPNPKHSPNANPIPNPNQVPRYRKRASASG